MALLRQEPRPRDPLVDASRNITYRWGLYLDALIQTVTQQPTVPSTPTSVAASDAAISPTPLTLGTNNQGLFRVSWFLRIVTPATTSGDVQIVIRATDKTVTYAQAGAVLDQAVDTVQSGSVLCRRDQGTAITFETVYNSVGAQVLEYDLVVIVEVVNAAATT